jgi:hypothetical protein
MLHPISIAILLLSLLSTMFCWALFEHNYMPYEDIFSFNFIL